MKPTIIAVVVYVIVMCSLQFVPKTSQVDDGYPTISRELFIAVEAAVWKESQ